MKTKIIEVLKEIGCNSNIENIYEAKTWIYDNYSIFVQIEICEFGFMASLMYDNGEIIPCNKLDNIDTYYETEECALVEGLFCAIEWIKNNKQNNIQDSLDQKNIIKQIKTFKDAENWCLENSKENLVREYNDIVESLGLMLSDHILAYLKGRIISATLNEGWEPKEDDYRWVLKYNKDCIFVDIENDSYGITTSQIYFKSYDIANYALKQFGDIYKKLFMKYE